MSPKYPKQQKSQLYSHRGLKWCIVASFRWIWTQYMNQILDFVACIATNSIQLYACFPPKCLDGIKHHQKQASHVPEDQIDVKNSFLAWKLLKLWPKTLVAYTWSAGPGGASGTRRSSPSSSTHNLVKSASILEIFVSKYIRKKRGIHWRGQFFSKDNT